MLAASREHRARHRHVMRDLGDRLDRDTGGDPAHHRQLHRIDRDTLRAAGAVRGSGGAALDHPGGVHGGVAAQAFGQFHDLDRAGAVRQTADEAAFLERRDQPVDAGLGAQVQRLLHLVEGRRHAVALHPFMNEFK